MAGAPYQLAGAGNNSTARNVIGITYSALLSSVPQLQAWDTSALTTILNQVFTGTAGNGSIPMVSAVATSDGAPVSAWKPGSATAGGATINRLKGSTNFVNLNATTPSSGTLPGGVVAGFTGTDPTAGGPGNPGGTSRFNVVIEIPSDATVPSSVSSGGSAPNILDHVLAVRVTYTGGTPTIRWYGNSSTGGGTEGTPTWDNIVSGVSPNTIQGVDSGVPDGGPYKFTRPGTGTADPTVYKVTV